jgi:hypothetical protein
MEKFNDQLENNKYVKVNLNDLEVGIIIHNVNNFGYLIVKKCQECSNHTLEPISHYSIDKETYIVNNYQYESKFEWYHCSDCISKFCTKCKCISCDECFNYIKVSKEHPSPPDTCLYKNCLVKRLNFIRCVLMGNLPYHMIEQICKNISDTIIAYWEWHINNINIQI